MAADDLTAKLDGAKIASEGPLSKITFEAYVVKKLHEEFLGHTCSYVAKLKAPSLGGYTTYRFSELAGFSKVIARCDGCGLESDITDYAKANK